MKTSGFTLVELIVALAFFSFMLLIVSAGFLQVSRIYQAGVSSRRTQQAARATLTDIAREVRSAGNISNVSGVDRLCLERGSGVVDYIRSEEQLRKLTYSGGCSSSPNNPSEVILVGQDGNLGSNVIMRQFNAQVINSDADSPISVEVSLSISTGFDSGGACDPLDPGSQFCSTTNLTNTISLRGTP